MKLFLINSKVLLPVLASIVVSPVCLLLAISSAGAGHGSYFVAKVLYPYTMLSTIIFGSIIIPFVALAILQYFIYGIGLSMAAAKGLVLPVALGLVILHTFAVLLCFLFIGENFS